MPGWTTLRRDLARIRAQDPDALSMMPDLTRPPDEGPVRIDLAAWAVDVAQGLHAAHGEYVELTVGAMTYPGRRLRSRHPPTLPALMSSAVYLDVVPVGRLSVPTGRSHRADVLVTQHGAGERRLETNGHLPSWVVDEDGRVVGGYVGWQAMPMITFTARPGESVVVPVLIGAASLVPEIGFAVPPGVWGLVAELRLSDRTVRTPAFPLTVVAGEDA